MFEPIYTDFEIVEQNMLCITFLVQIEIDREMIK